MSIASQLQAYQNGLTDAYNMVSQKGGTMPVHKNMSSLASSIATIPAGSTGIPREVSAQGVYGYPTQSFGFSLPSNATNTSNYALYRSFYACSSIASADLSSLTTASGSYSFDNAFYNCTNLASVDLSSLATVNGYSAFNYAFAYCSSLASVNLSSLAAVSVENAFSYAFYSCTSLTSVSFPALATLTGNRALYYAFAYCSNLTSVSFPALTASSFGFRTNQFNYMLQGVTGCTVHFPAAIQSTIGSWSDVTNGFGGTNTTVSFDL